MNILRPGDEPMHYEDGSHRWVPPTADMDQEAWEAAIRAHLHHHRETFGGNSSARANPPPPRGKGRPTKVTPADPAR
jgi:hypothetical protein